MHDIRLIGYAASGKTEDLSYLRNNKFDFFDPNTRFVLAYQCLQTSLK